MNPLANSSREKPSTTKSSIGGGLGGGPKRFFLPTETKTSRLRAAQKKAKEANNTAPPKRYGQATDPLGSNDRKGFGATTKINADDNPFAEFASGADVCATEPNDELTNDM